MSNEEYHLRKCIDRHNAVLAIPMGDPPEGVRHSIFTTRKHEPAVWDGQEAEAFAALIDAAETYGKSVCYMQLGHPVVLIPRKSDGIYPTGFVGTTLWHVPTADQIAGASLDVC